MHDIFLLGPGRDDKGADAPLRVRQELARRMRSTGTHAIVMEDEPDREGENNFAKFRRLIDENRPVTYLVLVPLHARLHGISVEIGHLLTLIQEGRLDSGRVHLFLQSLLASVDHDGALALNEPGNRTRYYEDLIDEGCPVHRWTDRRELNNHAVSVALEDDARA